MTRRLFLTALIVAFSLGLTINGTRPPTAPERQWLQFSTEPVEEPNTQGRLVVNRANVALMSVGWKATLPEWSDGIPLYVSGTDLGSGDHDLIVVETVNGRLVAFDAHGGETLWQTEPPAGPRWTTSSPAIDLDGQFAYAYCLDGAIHKYRLRDGQEVLDATFPALVTKKPDVEKGSSNLTIARAKDGDPYLYMTIAAYPVPGDEGDYQGHLVTIDLLSGQKRVFNALCSDRAEIFDDSGGAGDCSELQAGIWARSGAVYDSTLNRLFLTIGNGTFDADRGGYNWGSSVVALRPDGSTDGGTPLDSYTPANHQQLTDDDLDLSSTTIAVLPTIPGQPRLGVQGGKDGKLRLLNLEDLSGAGSPRQLGGELDIVDLTQGGAVMTQPVAWQEPGTRRDWLFVANQRGVSAFRLITTPAPHLVAKWSTRAVKGNSPVMANRMLFLSWSNALTALDPLTGQILWKDTSIGTMHWSSPIFVNGALYICDQSRTVYQYRVQ